MANALKVGLFYGTMLEHAEWIKHESEAQNIQVELFNQPFEEPEKLDEYDSFLFMAHASEVELVKSFLSVSFIVNELEIPFIWAVDKKKNPMAYRSFHNFEELGDVQIFLTTLFELAEEFKPKKPQKESIMSKLKSELAKKSSPQEEEVIPPREQVQPPTREEEPTDVFGGIEDLGDLPPLEEIGSSWNQTSPVQNPPMQDWDYNQNQQGVSPNNQGFTKRQGDMPNMESIFADSPDDNKMEPNHDFYRQQEQEDSLPPYVEPYQQEQPIYQEEEPFNPSEIEFELPRNVGQSQRVQPPVQQNQMGSYNPPTQSRNFEGDLQQADNWNPPIQSRNYQGDSQPVRNMNQAVQPPQQQRRQTAPVQQQPVAPYTYGQEQPQAQRVQQRQPQPPQQSRQQQMAPVQPNNGQGFPMQQQQVASPRQNQASRNMGGTPAPQPFVNMEQDQPLGGYSNFDYGQEQDMGYSAPTQPNYPPQRKEPSRPQRQQPKQQPMDTVSLFGNDDFSGNDNGFSVFEGQNDGMFTPPSPMYFEPEMEPIEEQVTVKSLPNVIAVAGAGHGVGTSFVALNLAYILQAILVEGNKTGTLAEWIGREGSVDREAYLHGEARNHGSFAVIASGELKSNDELNMLKVKATHQMFVVDCTLHSQVWKLAEHKVFVMSPDPQYRHVAIPSDAKWVLNKMPQDFPVEQQKLFNRKPDLLIYENGREVMLSLWGKVPYLSKQGQTVKHEWMTLVSGQTTSNTYDKGDDFEWNLGKTL